MMFIAENRSLESLTERWNCQRSIALDTEFIRERTYFPELCLLQLSLPQGNDVDDIYLVDVLALSPLPSQTQQMLETWSGEVLIHSMRQDIEALGASAWSIGGRWYDTQIAAAHLSWDLQVGYGKLVHDITGVELEKTQQRTDWSRRPLSAKQQEYARNDVRYLAALRDTLDERLDALGRREWALEDMARTYDEAIKAVATADAYKRIKSFYHHPEVVRRRIRYLADWRETTAIQKNLPRGWVIKDDALVAIAELGPRAKFPKAWEKPLRGIIDEADTAPAIDADTQLLRGKPSAGEKAHRDELSKRIKKFADEVDMAANVIATRAEVDALVADTTPPRFRQGWRATHVLPYVLNG